MVVPILRPRRRAVAVLGAAIAALSLAACSTQAPSSAQSNPPSSSTPKPSIAGQSITLYSGQHEQTVSALVADFEKQTGVKVNVRSGDEAELANQILQEGAATPADVYFAENPPALTTLENKGLLAKVDSGSLSAVPAGDSSAKGDWVGVSARQALFVYNTDKVSAAQAPTSVKDLSGSAWKGRLGLAPSETDFTPIVTRVIKELGSDGAKAWLDGLKANGKVYDNNEDLVAAVNRGEVAGGVVDSYYWYRLRDEQGASGIHSALGYFKTSDPGALVDVSGAAVLASSKHQDAAQAFLAYLVSKPAQQIIATSTSYEYPLLDGVQDTRIAKALKDAGPVVPAADLGDGTEAIQLMQSVGLLS
ncbi:extracellular solute-binding protein [Sinomonas sp. ASV322]|uniref:extracellular solute-binding protein n=1 Tax=Sinomonas sp. ASV322 TaxID=3041920 RepID=UPI0027DAC45C|nr:extracellular solute-binding protein [Sinomonas sp. ASV322]MDQ4501297.1 extracellular solute-binding protein [Sinomonas sp. ASV322]